MDPEFAEIFGEASIVVDDELLRKRWAGIETAAEEFGPERDLALLYLGRPSVDPEFVAAFRKIFFEKDSTFLMRKNGVEVRVLAGALLAHLFRGSHDRLLPAALAVICADCGGLVKGSVVPAAVSRAWEVIETRATAHRNRAVTGADDLSGPVFRTLAEKLGQAAASGDVKATAAASSEGFAELTRVADKFAALAQAHDAVAEESNILWWLFGQMSTRLGTPCRELDGAIAVFHLAEEMAELTTSRMGPLSARSILARMIAETKSNHAVSFKGLFEKATSDECRIVSTADKSSDLLEFCPMHFALGQAADLSSNAQAVSVVSAVMGLKVTKATALDRWAAQFYRESLLLRFKSWDNA